MMRAPKPIAAPAVRSPIRILTPEVSARIAAGEVIERPASIVKELIENALDAAAAQIRVDIRGGGLTMIRVGDDGIGIPREELPLALLRYATSKLPGDDLGRVRTLGFRGEALPSMAAVADLTIVSAADQTGLGRRITLRDGRIVDDQPAPRTRGTTVTVRGLFSRLPARLASLSRSQTELAQIGQVVRRLALVGPGVRMALVVDGRTVVQTSGSGELATTLGELYGAGMVADLVPLRAVETPAGRLGGIVGAPELTRPGRSQIHILVNGRWVQPRGLIARLETSYRSLLPRGRHPVLVLVIDTEPENIDINVHPSKLEVRLRSEAEIGQAAGELLREALGSRPRPVEFDTTAARRALDCALTIAEPRAEWDEIAPIVTPRLPPLRLIGQLQTRLLLLEGQDGLYLIDQHRAHERVIFERLASRHDGSTTEPVALPEPVVLELRPWQVDLFGRRLDDLAALGFRCEQFGERTFLLRSAPIMPGVLAGGTDDRLRDIGGAHHLGQALLELVHGDAWETDDWQQRLTIQLACRTALRRGRRLERPAMRALVEALGTTSSPAVCPHGSPIISLLSETYLERQFDWR